MRTIIVLEFNASEASRKKMIMYLLRAKSADFGGGGGMAHFPGQGQINFLSRRGQIIYFQCPQGQKIYFQKLRAPPTQNQMFAP